MDVRHMWGYLFSGGQAVVLLELESAVEAAGTGGGEHSLHSAVPVAHLKNATGGSVAG